MQRHIELSISRGSTPRSGLGGKRFVGSHHVARRQASLQPSVVETKKEASYVIDCHYK